MPKLMRFDVRATRLPNWLKTRYSLLVTPHSPSVTQHSRSCDYCGLLFSGPGYGDHRFCCYGCALVHRIMRSQGGEGVAAWLLVRLGIGACLAMSVMMISVVLYTDSAAELGASAVRGLRWALLILSTPGIVILGMPFIAGCLRDARRARLSTDALIVTGSMAAFGVSAVNVVRGGGSIYFDTAVMLLLIVTIGRLLEASAKNRTSHAIRDLIDLAPATARVIRDGVETQIPASEVVKGDVLVVKPGERIPADGRVASGECFVEEPAFTGEARPRACSPGDAVFGGSVNCDGLIMVRAEAVGSESLLARMQALVAESQRNRAPVERAAERAASVFVPGVWLVAASAGVYWSAAGNPERALLSGLAVLVVACPCALGLATPMAACIAMGMAAKEGVLIRSGEALERMSSVKRVFFDKTGTLTENDLAVTDVRVTGTDDVEEVLKWVAPLERGSEHSIAKAIVTACDERGLDGGKIEAFRAIPGKGVEGEVTIKGLTRRVTVGSLDLFADAGGMGSGGDSEIATQEEEPSMFRRSTNINENGSVCSRVANPGNWVRACETPDHRVPDSPLSALCSGLPAEESTVTFAGWEGRVRAAILLADHARPEAAAVIRALHEMGVRPAMISGDGDGPVRRMAEQLGIADFFFRCSPTGKAEIVSKALRKVPDTGRKAYVAEHDTVLGDTCGQPPLGVAMVGDGINDAPALAAADVGIAAGGGADLARESSDVTLLGADLSRIPWVIDLSRRTYRIIRQNLAWAFVYNCVAIAFAFAGLLHPLIAAAAMVASSLSVIINSMRLMRFEPPENSRESSVVSRQSRPAGCK